MTEVPDHCWHAWRFGTAKGSVDGLQSWVWHSVVKSLRRFDPCAESLVRDFVADVTSGDKQSSSELQPNIRRIVALFGDFDTLTRSLDGGTNDPHSALFNFLRRRRSKC